MNEQKFSLSLHIYYTQFVAKFQHQIQKIVIRKSGKYSSVTFDQPVSFAKNCFLSL